MAGFFQDIVMEKAMKDRVSAIAAHDRTGTPDVSGSAQEGISLLDPGSDSQQEPDLDVDEDWGGDDLESIRARRMAALQQSAKQILKFQGLGHGESTEITESEFLDAVIKSPRALVHFYHPEFVRSQLVDTRLAQAAPLVMGCRFLKVNAEKCPFFVNKLNIKVLPTIVYFVGGKTVHRVTGEFGSGNDFSLAALLRNLKTHKMLVGSEEEKYGSFMDGGRHRDDSGDEDDS